METGLRLQLRAEFDRLATDMRKAADTVITPGRGVAVVADGMGRELDALAATARLRHLPDDVVATLADAATRVRRAGRNAALGTAEVEAAAVPEVLVGGIVRVATSRLQDLLCPGERVDDEDAELNAALRYVAKHPHSGAQLTRPPDFGQASLAGWPPAPYAPWSTAPPPPYPRASAGQYSVAGSVHLGSSPAPPPPPLPPPAREPPRAPRRTAAARQPAGPSMLTWLRGLLGDRAVGCFACAHLGVAPPPSDHGNFCSPLCPSYVTVAAAYKTATGCDAPPRRAA